MSTNGWSCTLLFISVLSIWEISCNVVYFSSSISLIQQIPNPPNSTTTLPPFVGVLDSLFDDTDSTFPQDFGLDIDEADFKASGSYAHWTGINSGLNIPFVLPDTKISTEAKEITFEYQNNLQSLTAYLHDGSLATSSCVGSVCTVLQAAEMDIQPTGGSIKIKSDNFAYTLIVPSAGVGLDVATHAAETQGLTIPDFVQWPQRFAYDTLGQFVVVNGSIVGGTIVSLEFLSWNPANNELSLVDESPPVGTITSGMAGCIVATQDHIVSVVEETSNNHLVSLISTSTAAIVAGHSFSFDFGDKIFCASADITSGALDTISVISFDALNYYKIGRLNIDASDVEYCAETSNIDFSDIFGFYLFTDGVDNYYLWVGSESVGGISVALLPKDGGCDCSSCNQDISTASIINITSLFSCQPQFIDTAFDEATTFILLWGFHTGSYPVCCTNKSLFSCCISNSWNCYCRICHFWTL